MTDETHAPTPEDHGETPPAAEGIEEVLVEHEERLTVLQGSVEAMGEAVEDLLASPPKKTPAPWNWKELDGEKSVALMEALREWVDWINDRYGVSDSSRIYGCWYRHSAGCGRTHRRLARLAGSELRPQRPRHRPGQLAQGHLLAHARTHRIQTLGTEQLPHRTRRPAALFPGLHRRQLQRISGRARSQSSARSTRSRQDPTLRPATGTKRQSVQFTGSNQLGRSHMARHAS